MRQRQLPLGRVVALAVWFVLLWTLLWADVSAANLISGAVVALAVLLLTRGSAVASDDTRLRLAPFALLRFTGHVLWQLVKSNLRLAWEIVTPTDSIATGTVEVPLRSAAPIVTMAVSNVITLTPGTVTLDVSEDPPMLTIGVLHLHDPEEIRAGVQQTEELAIRAFGTAAARAALAGGRPT